MTKKILFLCTGNSCRSQMAEGFGKKFAPAGWEIYSAGIEAHGLNRQAVAVMAEVGVDISCQTSDIVSQAMMEGALVITLCGHAKDNCPVLPPDCEHRHWGLDDPAQAKGSEEEVTRKFREVRDEIERRIQALMAELKEEKRRG